MLTSCEPGAPNPGLAVPLCVPEIRGNEWLYVKECLDTGWVSSVGPFVDRFERELAAQAGAAHGVATVTGTAALHVALLVAGVQPDDEVLVSDLTFIAPVNAIRYVDAWPVLVDAEARFWQMDCERVAAFLSEDCERAAGGLRNKATGRRVKALLPVHVLGHPVDMDPLLEMAQVHELAVIEDATESLGANYRGRPAGSLGDLGCFSFNGNKIISTGGGGMLVTGHEAWARRARYLTTQAKDDPVEYVHQEIGYNYRLTNVQAALGCAQLERLAEYVAIKREIAAVYREALAGLPGITPMREAPWAFSTHWMYTVLIDRAQCGLDSRDVLRRLQSAGIQARPLWQPMHRSPAHEGCQMLGGHVSDQLHRDALSLPCSVGLSSGQQARVIDEVQHVLRTGG